MIKQVKIKYDETIDENSIGILIIGQKYSPGKITKNIYIITKGSGY